MPCFSLKHRIVFGLVVLFSFWFTDKTVSLSVVALSAVAISEGLIRLLHMARADGLLPAPAVRTRL